MKSLIHFILRLYLDFLYVLIILDEYRGITDKYSLNRTANFLPWELIVVEIEIYDNGDHFVYINAHIPLHFQSLQIVWATWCINLQYHFPNGYPKLIFSRNIYIVWSVDD
jgi:hypothetical protein